MVVEDNFNADTWTKWSHDSDCLGGGHCVGGVGRSKCITYQSISIEWDSINCASNIDYKMLELVLQGCETSEYFV